MTGTGETGGSEGAAAAAAASAAPAADAGAGTAGTAGTAGASAHVHGGIPNPTPHRRGRHLLVPRWSQLSYTSRMAFAFAAIAAMTVIVATGVLSFVWNQHFQTYTRDNMETIASSTADRVAESYEATGTWTQETVAMAVYVHAAYSGIGISVVDADGNVRYDSAADDAKTSGASSGEVSADASGADADGSGDAGGSAAPSASASSSPASDAAASDSAAGEAQKSASDPVSSALSSDPAKMASAPIVVNGQPVGMVRVWVYGSDSLQRQVDREFRDNSYRAMILASILAIVLASCIGIVFARNLVKPINRMTRTAHAIKEGDLSARTGLTGDDEIARLGETFDLMAEAVENDRKLERRLTTDVAHELRTPLMAIQSTVEAMVDGVLDADEERLETVNSEVQRLSRLVSAILKLSRLENRSTPMKEEPVDVGGLVEDILATHEAYVNDSGLSLRHEIEPGVLILGDADLIRQATANLISNAVRYTPEGGTITVRVKRGDIMANICVEDTGIGLTPEEAKMVFSRFWRADAGRTRESGGLGIGLSVVKEIVDRHHGWVKVEGQPNVGARFTILIPLLDSEVTKQRLRQAEKAEKAAKAERARARSKAAKAEKAAKGPKGPRGPRAVKRKR